MMFEKRINDDDLTASDFVETRVLTKMKKVQL